MTLALFLCSSTQRYKCIQDIVSAIVFRSSKNFESVFSFGAQERAEGGGAPEAMGRRDIIGHT